jgi:hypothetical protein
VAVFSHKCRWLIIIAKIRLVSPAFGCGFASMPLLDKRPEFSTKTNNVLIMNSFFNQIGRLVLAGFIGWLATGCASKTTTDVTPTDSRYRIQQYMANTKSQFYNQTDQTTFDYDTKGNLLKASITSNQTPQNGAIATQTTSKTNSYLYAADGLLLMSLNSQERNTITLPTKTIQELITTTASFSYTSNRLSGYVSKRVGAYGITTTTVGKLVYDNTGDLLTRSEISTNVVSDPSLVKEIPIGSGSSSRVWTYQKGQLTDYAEKTDAGETRPFTIQNGLITKISGAGYEVRYGYDGQQRLIKQETFLGGKLNDYFTQTWADVKPASAALPAFLGFPVGISVLDALLPTGILATQTTFSLNPVTNVMVQYATSTSTVQANAAGFIGGATITTKNVASAASQDKTTTETYTYITL